MIAINGIEEIRNHVGRELGVSEWHEVAHGYGVAWQTQLSGPA